MNSESYNIIKSIVLSKFPHNAVHSYDWMKHLWVDGDYYFPGRCKHVILNCEGSEFWIPYRLDINQLDYIVPIDKNNDTAIRYTQYSKAQKIDKETISNMCDKLLYDVKQLQEQYKINQISKDF